MGKKNNTARGQSAVPETDDILDGFDIDNPVLPAAISDSALASGGFPYDRKVKNGDYDDQLIPLQIELLKLQAHIEKRGERFIVLFEGRDTSGKGGVISTVLERMNPRHARAVALSKPTEVERGQWYYQRYIQHFPTRGDILLFDRSWYNRAGVEPVMGFCTPEQHAEFLERTPDFERLLVKDGFRLVKLFLTVGRQMQLKRFHERKHNPLKQWKLTDIDLAAIHKWDAYSAAQKSMLNATHTPQCPWTIVHANDQKRMRLEVIRLLLSVIDYDGRNPKVAIAPDPKIVGSGPQFLGLQD